MNKVATQRQSRPFRTDLSLLLDGLPAFAALRPLLDSRTIRVEDELYEDMYEVRAELPGVDPDDDIEVTVCDGRLTITADRPRPGENTGRSEFTYGSLSRTLTLPDGADPDDVNATYDRGILTVLVPLSDEHRLEKHIEVVEVVSIEDLDDQSDDDQSDDDQSDDAEALGIAADQVLSVDRG